jgi:hypothetical protein
MTLTATILRFIAACPLTAVYLKKIAVRQSTAASQINIAGYQ